MEPPDASMSPDQESDAARGGERSEDPVAASARGWQRIQLGVLGFIGLCGVLWAGGDSPAPRLAQWLAAVLVVVALGLAILSIYLVGRIAYPFGEKASRETRSDADWRRLRRGVALTYLAVVVLVLATLSAWVPRPDDAAGTIELSDAAGRTWCGDLAEAPTGTVRLDTVDGTVTVPLDAVAELRPVSGC